MSKTTQEQLNRIKNAKTIEEAYIILSNLEKPYYLQYKIDTKKIYNTRMSLGDFNINTAPAWKRYKRKTKVFRDAYFKRCGEIKEISNE